MVDYSEPDNDKYYKSDNYDWCDWSRVDKLLKRIEDGDTGAMDDLDEYFPHWNDRDWWHELDPKDYATERTLPDGTKVSFTPKCLECSWYGIYGNYRCSAFNSGIPLDVWRGQTSHKKALPGDSGFQFSPKRKD